MIWASEKEEIYFTCRASNLTSLVAKPFIRTWTKKYLSNLILLLIASLSLTPLQ